jgi:hypothetical protein
VTALRFRFKTSGAPCSKAENFTGEWKGECEAAWEGGREGGREGGQTPNLQRIVDAMNSKP